MRRSLSLFIIGACVVGPTALAQTATGLPATSQPAASQPAASQPAASHAATREVTTEVAITHAATSPAAASPSAGIQRSAHGASASSSGHSPPRHPGHPGKANKGSAVAGNAGGVLNLGATDITGNKELPKVMVIVPWKGSLGADGVIKPTDSLMDEVLAPVDRGVFQRQVRYYGQLSGGGRPPAGSGPENRPRKDGRPRETVAPVGDSH